MQSSGRSRRQIPQGLGASLGGARGGPRRKLPPGLGGAVSFSDDEETSPGGMSGGSFGSGGPVVAGLSRKRRAMPSGLAAATTQDRPKRRSMPSGLAGSQQPQFDPPGGNVINMGAAFQEGYATQQQQDHAAFSNRGRGDGAINIDVGGTAGSFGQQQREQQQQAGALPQHGSAGMLHPPAPLVAKEQTSMHQFCSLNHGNGGNGGDGGQIGGGGGQIGMGNLLSHGPIGQIGQMGGPMGQQQQTQQSLRLQIQSMQQLQQMQQMQQQQQQQQRQQQWS